MERFYQEVVNNGNLALLDELCSTDYVDHDDDVATPGREGLKQHLAMIRRGFPDTRVTVEDLVADGDKVAARTTHRGTHTEDFMGMPPTGKQVTMSGMDITRLVDGKIVEHWGLVDAMAMMQQLGLAGSHH
jgi:steroid delta-isomerase-like uncharacterized protein